MNIEESLNDARKPGKAVCPECGDAVYATMDKLSISLYGMCAIHINDGEEQNNLLTLSERI